MASRALAKQALDKNEERLSALPYVVGLGIDESDPKRNAVAVYVEQKVPVGELLPKQRIPSRLYVTNRGARKAVPVHVIEQGPVSLERGGFEP